MEEVDAFDQLDRLPESLSEEMNSIAGSSASKVLDMHYVMEKVAEVVQSDTRRAENDEDCVHEGKSGSLALFQELCHEYFNCPKGATLSGNSQYLPSFAKEIQEKVFDPFFTTKRSLGGTGLGLSVSAGIVKEHNGVIDIESKPGSGTKVVVSFPTVDST